MCDGPRAGRLLLAGKTPVQATHSVCVERQMVLTGKAVPDDDDIHALRAMPSRGRPAGLVERQSQVLGRALLDKPTDHRLGTQLGRLKCVGVLIERLRGVKSVRTQPWRTLAGLGFSAQEHERRAIERDEETAQNWKRKT